MCVCVIQRLLLIVVVVLIVTGLFLFTFESTVFNVEGFVLVLAASVISGLRWSTAQLTLQKAELGGCGLALGEVRWVWLGTRMVTCGCGLTLGGCGLALALRWGKCVLALGEG